MPRSQDTRLLGELADADDHVARRAADALAPLRAPAARAGLSACLQREYDSLRIAAAFALAEIADAQAIPPLRAAVRRHDCRSALMAASILGELRATEAAGDLIELMKGSPIDDAAQTALAALAMLGDPSNVPATIARLKIELARGVDKRKSFPARRAALDALAVLAAPGEGRELIVQALQDGDLYDQRSALTALGLIGGPADHALLVAQQGSKDAGLRERAALASLLVAPAQLTVADAERLVHVLAQWRSNESHTLVVVPTMMQRLANRVALDDGAALASNPPAWALLADAIARFAEDSINRQRAALVAGERRNPWQLPALKRSLELFEDLAPRWASIRARLR